jgi:hypothetical protein
VPACRFVGGGLFAFLEASVTPEQVPSSDELTAPDAAGSRVLLDLAVGWAS